ncbi:MAG: GNAT family N-acetyltransferase [Deltaproteobacteria bacterium HGW-Deltaproteobacteria-21]|nr:MAG: GNAT family N-acetyltransferase [Deltaproteobacteria bacterium HGW-Deltaproteobacteria-21]
MVTKGYFPGVVGKVIELHATYYHAHWGFDVSFETQEGRELCDFISRFREGVDFFRAALVERTFAGAIAIDAGPHPEEGVRLRWFIVDPRFHGKGIGRRLLEEAMSFCTTAGYVRVYLWTFQGLEAAHHLYQCAGFRLAEEREVAQWGQSIREQMFEMIHQGRASGDY